MYWKETAMAKQRTAMRRTLIGWHNRIWNWTTREFTREDGQGLTEYALILALIAIVAIAALTLLGGKVTSALSTVSRSLIA
jgi:pilus assembly protein Flp/PilA